MPDHDTTRDSGKYAPLGRYLQALPASRSDVTLSYADIERIIGEPLPPSATEHHHQWWANRAEGSRAPYWAAAGFKVDGVDLTRRRVRFVRKDVRPPRVLTLQEVVTELNTLAPYHDIGTLPVWRRTRHGLTRVPAATLFFSTVEPDRDWAFHAGGLTELQFNVGFEEIEGQRMFRHGVGFSLQPTRELPDIAPMVPKIERFNEYLRVYPNTFEGLAMWYWHKDHRSENYSVGPIPDKLITRDTFIFLGTQQRANEIDFDWILKDFDRLLPLYQFVEGTQTFPRPSNASPTFEWTPGNKARAPRTKYTREELSVDKALRHNIVQAALFEHLESIHGQNASGEQSFGNGTRVDVATRDGDGTNYVYYELKTGLSARSCIRDAIGQLLEYSYWPGAQLAHRLVVVGEAEYDNEAKSYVKKLRKNFSLPIEYQQFDMKSRSLV
jgi:hypothetical protein